MALRNQAISVLTVDFCQRAEPDGRNATAVRAKRCVFKLVITKLQHEFNPSIQSKNDLRHVIN